MKVRVSLTLPKNLTYHSKSKHINVRYHWIREVLKKKQLQVEKIHITENESYMMTKSLPKDKSYMICWVHLIWVVQSQSLISLGN